MTAAQIVEALVHRVPTAEASVVYTAKTDPNHKIGQPGGYTSKASWIDARIRVADVLDSSEGSTDLGGSVEVYPTAAEADARAVYIQAALKANPGIGAETDLLSGGYLVRVSSYLPASAVAVYRRALAATGIAVEVVTG